MAQIFAPDSKIQRVSSQSSGLVTVFYRTNSLVQNAQTTMYTVPLAPQGYREEITFATFVSRGTPAPTRVYEILLYVLYNSGSFPVYQAARGELAADGSQWRPFSRGYSLPLEPGYVLQYVATEQGSAGNPLAIDVYIGGIRHVPQGST